MGKSASCIYLDLFGLRPILKGHGQLCDRADLDTTFASLKSVYHNPKSNLRVGYILKSASILPSISFDPRSFTENLFRSKLLLILLHYLIINKIKTVFKGKWNRRGEKRIGAAREKLSSFTKITREMNQ